MSVSQTVDAELRRAVAEGRRPRPEYLELEAVHGVELLDWSQLPVRPGGRSATRSLHHARALLRRLDGFDAVFSDGEHVGIPLSIAMRLLRRSTPHLVLGHHLTSPAKRPFFRALGAARRMDRVLVHSPRQRLDAERELGIPGARLHYVPYFTDTGFWCSQGVPEEPMVVAAGREHRDYRTLAEACAGLPVRVRVADGSHFSPDAVQARPDAWPDNFEAGFADYLTLRDWYSRAAVVALPLVPNDFQAGITTLLEAMSMGKAVVVSQTEGQADVVVDGETAVVVPAGDATALREAIRRLLADTRLRRRLGDNARAAVAARHDLRQYADTLAGHLWEVARGAPARPPAALT